MLKKIISVLLCLGVVLGFSACGSDSSGDEVKKIGVIQLIQHESLDSAYEGFVAALKDNGYEDGKNIELDFQNAAGDQSNCQTISDGFVNDNKDLILAIGTPAAQAAASKTSDIPILVTAVTDPADAGLVKSNEKPETNVSGTSDMTPVKDQLEVLKEFCPEAKTVGLLYSSNEANSVLQAKIAKEEAKKLGLTLVEATVSSSNEIQQVVSSVIDKVDAIYIPTDNTFAAGMATVALVTNEAKVPVFCGAQAMATDGGLACYGIDYYDLGYKTGLQAIKVLKGEADVSTMPIEYLSGDDLKLVVNEDTLKTLNMEIPSSLQDKLVK
ncbi:ABC transporter substrate-binding protein [Anaerofustis butyriciformans]|uniref:ABC transporter substrate-binding protein n=1 Tax=Anaerofustis butyriciformans TaxID=3108533 RepID=UPI002E3289A5|nr:ABC transporter substrate-binding protein [Anaerofustis sp. HA2171]